MVVVKNSANLKLSGFFFPSYPHYKPSRRRLGGTKMELSTKTCKHEMLRSGGHKKVE